MDVRIQLRELIMQGSIQLDGGGTLSITDVETAILNRDVVGLLRAELPGFIESTSLAIATNDQSEINQKLYAKWIGEYNEARPGSSGTAWGIQNNGICLLVTLCAEALTADL
jgi:hypothetical protein